MGPCTRNEAPGNAKLIIRSGAHRWNFQFAIVDVGGTAMVTGMAVKKDGEWKDADVAFGSPLAVQPCRMDRAVATCRKALSSSRLSPPRATSRSRYRASRPERTSSPATSAEEEADHARQQPSCAGQVRCRSAFFC